MPSSPTRAEQLTECYSEAFLALLQGQLEQVVTLLDTADDLIAAIGADTLEPESREQITCAYSKLMSALLNERNSTKEQLTKLRRGRYQLKKIRFRPAADLVGTRVFSEA